MCARRIIVRFLSLFLFGLLTVPLVRGQQYADFSDLASQAAGAIQESLKDLPPQSARVLVVDFEEGHGTTSELGPELAREFSITLQEHAQGFAVLKPDDLKKAVTRNSLPNETLSDSTAMKCYAPDLGATMLVTGSMEYAPDGVLLQIDMWREKPRKSIFGKLVVVPMSAAMMGLAAKSIPSRPPFFTHDDTTWVNPSHSPVAEEKLATPQQKAGSDYRPPECAICFPPASYSDDAVWTRLQGTVVLRVQISPDGFPAKISVVRGLPCGLTETAINAVKHWKFKPATVDDIPVAVETDVEVTFHLS
jgi:TonB family protein